MSAEPDPKTLTPLLAVSRDVEGDFDALRSCSEESIDANSVKNIQRDSA
jgi:hypothetical protein